MAAMIGVSAGAYKNLDYVPIEKHDPGTEISYNNTISIEQSVQGNGYSMQYLYAKANAAELKEYSHGSGSLDSEMLLNSYLANKTTHLNDAYWNDFDEDCIRFQQTVNSWTYAPYQFTFGTGYYAQPTNYESLLKEKTWIKNRVAGTSIQNEIEYAHAVVKDIDAIVKTKSNITYDPVYESVGFSEFRVDQTVTDGRIHIGALQASQGNQAWSKKWNRAWQNPDLEIDEDFVGTYHVQKNITINVPYKWNKPSYDWLPCCSGGWDSIPITYKWGFGSSAKGIFDCTCRPTALSQYKPAWDGTKAQFPRQY
jgi:hypothetical protein